MIIIQSINVLKSRQDYKLVYKFRINEGFDNNEHVGKQYYMTATACIGVAY